MSLNKHGEVIYMYKKHSFTIIRILTSTLFLSGALLMQLNEVQRLVLYYISYLIIGSGVLIKAVNSIYTGRALNESVLMSIATIGAFLLGEYPEGVAVMLFYTVGELFERIAVNRSKRSITELMDIRPDYANIESNGQLIRVSPDEVKVGDIIVVKVGEKIPLDGVVEQGCSSVDASSLTGETLPVDVCAGDSVFSGGININRLLSIRVSKPFSESTVSKILELVENSRSRKAGTENFITAFSVYYTPIVVVLAFLTAVIPPLLFGGEFNEWIRRALIFLVISCPCALVLSVPLSFFGGIGGASRQGILVKGGNYLEALSRASTVIFDKTGTLTKGTFSVSGINPQQGCDKKTLLELAALAESYSDHPIALSLKKEYGKRIDNSRISKTEDLSGYGVRTMVDGRIILAGNRRLMNRYGIKAPDEQHPGTVVYISADGIYIGQIIISDEIKESAPSAIDGLKSVGVNDLCMLTGDRASSAGHIAEALGIDRVYSGLLPAEKVKKLEEILGGKKSGTVVYVGDGINDAPVLTRADIGIAMGGLGSDAAIEAADIVLMDDNPEKIVTAIKTAKKTMRIVWQNIVFALGIKVIIMLLGIMGFSGIWEAVFADVGVSVLAVLNALRAMKL